MKREILFSITVNTLLAAVFVLSNMWALNMGLEETCIALAFLYGALTVRQRFLYNFLCGIGTNN